MSLSQLCRFLLCPRSTIIKLNGELCWQWKGLGFPFCDENMLEFRSQVEIFCWDRIANQAEEIKALSLVSRWFLKIELIWFGILSESWPFIWYLTPPSNQVKIKQKIKLNFVFLECALSQGFIDLPFFFIPKIFLALTFKLIGLTYFSCLHKKEKRKNSNKRKMKNLMT